MLYVRRAAQRIHDLKINHKEDSKRTKIPRLQNIKFKKWHRILDQKQDQLIDDN